MVPLFWGTFKCVPMILNRYLLKEFFRFVCGTLILCLFFFILFDFMQKAAGYLGKYSPSVKLLTHYYLLQVPSELYQAIPIASLISSIVVMILLSRTGEITAMRAVGMSPLRIIFPIACGGLILSALTFVLGEYVIPYTTRKSHYIKQITIEGEVAALNEGAYWVRTPEMTVHFKSYNPNKQSLSQLKILYLNEETFAPKRVLHADSAVYLAERKTWALDTVHEFFFNHEKKLTDSESIPKIEMPLPIEPSKLTFDRRTPFEMSLSEIGTVIETGQATSGDILTYRIAWHMKFAYPLAAFLITFLGLRFGYQTERGSETIRGMFLALLLALSYWFILSASKVLCSSGSLHPFFAGWLANIWIFFIAIYQFIRVARVPR